jgi:hypothetical protein
LVLEQKRVMRATLQKKLDTGRALSTGRWASPLEPGPAASPRPAILEISSGQWGDGTKMKMAVSPTRHDRGMHPAAGASPGPGRRG